MSQNNDTPLHIAMYPWLAMGHITSFLRIGNKLAKRGHKISFFLPPKTQLRFTSQNHHPELITFIPIELPLVEGFPVGAETTNDISTEARPLLMTAMDMTKDTIETHLLTLKPNFVFFDFTCWLPELAHKHGIKSIYYFSALLVRVAYTFHLSATSPIGDLIPESHLMSPLPSFPSPFMKHKAHEAKSFAGAFNVDFGGGLTLIERVVKSIRESDAIGIKTCKEMEGVYCEFFEKKYGKPVLTAGPVLPDPISVKLDDRFDTWLAGFGSGEVVYCAFGSECTLELLPFQELVLGLELTGRPFLAALKPPRGYETIESALPEDFLKRTKGRGIVYGGWVQQQLILRHPSVGCFVTHCGAGSLSEVMVNNCQIVMIPNAVDQFMNARLMSLELRVGVEVDTREDDGFFFREAVREAVEAVMEVDSEVGREVRANHTKWREFILKDGVEETYISGFIQKLYELRFEL
ncbi:UDP-glycosyltransferase 79B30-like [Silene latifolia]|uniref:UDP-glycosyltransferase 79B30-like n=1 Tax=Silene latifolia TaxID=37657 RepID=UPI003D7787E9